MQRQTQPLTRRQTLQALALSLLGAAPSLLAGCGRRFSSDERDASGRIVLDYWNGFTGPDGKTMAAMVAQFQRDTPDIRVRMQLIPWGTYYDKLTLAMAYGGAPDVFIMQAARFQEYASFNTLRPLADLYAEDSHPLGPADFAPVPYRESLINGVPYAFPLDIHPIGLYYNAKLFRDASIVDANGNAKPPATLPEFLDAAQKLTIDTDHDGRPDQWGFVITNQHSNWLTFAHQFGADIVTPDGKRGAMASPEALAATHLMCDLVYKYKICPRPEGVDAWLALREGKAAMAMEGIYMLSSLQEQKGLDFAGAPAPQFGPMPGAWGGTHLLCQPADISPARARAAWKFMRYLSDHSLTWGIGGQIPARADIERSAAFQALPVQSQFARQIDYVHYDPQIPRANALNQFADPAIEAALLQLQTPEEAMHDADRRIDQLLARP